MSELDNGVSTSESGGRATVSAGDYFNKISGERVERECREILQAGCRELVIDFGQTQIVNSVGVSILLGVIDSAQGTGAKVVLSGVNAPTIELFEMLGVTRHVEIA
jgi:anti-anti-sigma factor